MNLQYEAADQRDVAQIYCMARALIESYEDLSSIDVDKVLDWVRRKIERNIKAYTRVQANGEICGYYHLCDDGELDDFYILPECRSRGIGSQILRHCIAHSKNPLYLYVFSRNIRAISLYTRFGFIITENVGMTRLIMRRNG